MPSVDMYTYYWYKILIFRLLKAERDRLLTFIEVLPWHPESSENYGEIKADFERRGKLIYDFDIAIAAIAMSHKCGVSAPTVKEYFKILDDTLIGKKLPAFRKRAKRRLLSAPKFYFFDIGIVAHLTHRGKVEQGSELFGRTLEHFIYMQILAHSGYSELNYPISYWRTASGFEVDFVLNDHEFAIEVKSASMVGNRHLKGIRAFKEEYSARKYIVVSMDPKPRKTADDIDILPWNLFLDRLWEGKLFHKSI